MRVFLKQNVYEAAKERMNFIFDEFENVVCWMSGGKDSTTIFELALEVATERNRLPLDVAFLDQEVEWTHTYNYIKSLNDRDDVRLHWYQFPFQEFNATSQTDEWLFCWDEEKKDVWIRPKETDSIQENNYGTDRFKDLFDAIAKHDFPEDTAFLAGVRAEESPVRTLAITTCPFYKGITWGKKYKGTESKLFYPIYDWSYTDIWKYINDKDAIYNIVYDFQYRYGIKVQHMRVSNLNHETAVSALFYLQEIDTKLYNSLVGRLKGIDYAGKFGYDNYFIKDLPYMFKTWKEYRDYLLQHIVKKDRIEKFQSQLDKQDREFEDLPQYDNIVRAHINIILTNDWEGARFHNLEVTYSTKETRANSLKKFKNI